MATILSVVGFLFIFIATVNCQFRFDYSFNAKVGGWLKLHVIPANFHDAFRKCEAEGAVLASPLNIYLKNAMVSLHKKSVNKNCGLYTGINSIFTKGSFASVEGKPFTKISAEWAPNEPDNYNDTEDCIVMLQNGTMADVRCTETYPYVCYKKKTVNMALNECGTTDNGYQLDSRTGSCYKFHTIGRTWKQGYMVCMAEGGHLAIVNSETEAQVIKDLFAKNPADKLFSPWKHGASIGYHDWGETGVWYTIHVSCQFRYDYTFNIKVNGWLKLNTVPASFYDAFRKCNAEGAVLASPLNANLKNAMLMLRKTSNIDSSAVITGINSAFSKVSFASVEGVPIDKIPIEWAPFEPDNCNNNEDCIAMLTDGTMADVSCTETFPFVCYKKKTKTLQINECGTVDDAYTLEHRTGSCYKFHRIGRTWRMAYMTCMAEGGYLAIINSDTEAQVLKEILDKHPTNDIFAGWKDVASVGIHDWGDHGFWYTVHGQPIEDAGFSKFSNGEPNNNTSYEGGSFCGALFRNGLLDDIWCSGASFPFICEKKPDSLDANTGS